MVNNFKVCHIELSTANSFVKNHHRHHKVVQGHRFSIGAIYNNKLVGVAIVGRPVGREVDQLLTIEVTRLTTDGTRNACSFLYGACVKAGKSLGYHKIQTYILSSELGSSLKASGFVFSHVTKGREWKVNTDDIIRRTDLICDKHCYTKNLI